MSHRKFFLMFGQSALLHSTFFSQIVYQWYGNDCFYVPLMIKRRRGIRTPARLRVAVFETAAVLLGYLGTYSQNIHIIKQIKKVESDQVLSMSNNSSLTSF